MKKLLIMTVIAAMASVAPVFAQDEVQTTQPTRPAIERCQKPGPGFKHHRRMHRPPHFNMKKIVDELNLTDKQKEELKVLREKRMQEAKPLFEKLKANEQEARELRKQLRDIRIQGKKDFESVLTNKQLKKLEQLKAEQKQQFEQRRKDGMHRRPPMKPGCNCGPKRPTVEPKPIVEEK